MIEFILAKLGGWILPLLAAAAGGLLAFLFKSWQVNKLKAEKESSDQAITGYKDILKEHARRQAETDVLNQEISNKEDEVRNASNEEDAANIMRDTANLYFGVRTQARGNAAVPDTGSADPTSNNDADPDRGE